MMEEDRALPPAEDRAAGLRPQPPTASSLSSIPSAGYVTPPWERMWFDLECAEDGCQSLVWKSRYESAVRGRQDFRNAYRRELERAKELLEALKDLRCWAAVLRQNAIGCAQNHFGEDFELHGMPGWLADATASIATADVTIAKAEGR